MKSFLYIIGGAVLVAGGIYGYVWYNSPEQKRLRGLASPGTNTITARNQQALAGATPTIFHEPDLEPINVDATSLNFTQLPT